MGAVEVACGDRTAATSHEAVHAAIIVCFV